MATEIKETYLKIFFKEWKIKEWSTCLKRFKQKKFLRQNSLSKKMPKY